MDKKSIRPVLNLISVKSDENFQNEVLRPILKLQHEILILTFKNWSIQQKIKLVNLNKDKFQETLDKSFSKNVVIRNLILGIIIGQFTKDEFLEYQKNTSEFNRRIFSMAKQRLFDSFDQIKKDGNS
ncbi:glyoxalase [Tenacibaculum sp. ZS6-P6]|uniref:glyoxalase n=1 Tax=Tenacibaculum sp. ZS6-P6 TaxID=3447503 RepID=UPI003F9DF844